MYIKVDDEKMRKNGFTLIELLAVIVILAIIAVIAVPIVLNIIEDSKKNASLRSAEMYMDAVELSKANRVMHHGAIPNKAYPIMTGGNICLETYELKEGKYVCSDNDNNPNNNELEVEVNGEAPKSGQIVIGNGEIEDATVKYSNDKTIVMNNKGEFIYPPTPKSFAEDDWSTIVANVKAGNLSKYNVGDTKEISLTGFTNKETDSDGKYTIRIANTSTPSECSTEGYSQTACGFVIEFKDIIIKHEMNKTNTNVGGYPASLMYTYIQNDIYNALPEELKAVIIPTYVVSGHGNTSGEENFITEQDKLYLLSGKEVYGSDSSDTSSGLTRQLDYYSNIRVTTSSYSGAQKKLDGTSIDWWLRSAFSINTYYFYYVNNIGDWTINFAYYTYGVAVAFRIG